LSRCHDIKVIRVEEVRGWDADYFRRVPAEDSCQRRRGVLHSAIQTDPNDDIGNVLGQHPEVQFRGSQSFLRFPQCADVPAAAVNDDGAVRAGTLTGPVIYPHRAAITVHPPQIHANVSTHRSSQNRLQGGEVAHVDQALQHARIGIELSGCVTGQGSDRVAHELERQIRLCAQHVEHVPGRLSQRSEQALRQI